MKVKQYKIIFIITFVICIFGIFNTNSYAASMKMSINKTSAYVGETFTVTISGINGKVNISSNSNVSIDKSGSQWVDGSLTITGTTKTVGTGKITVTPVDVTTTAAEPEEVTESASKSITIKEKETQQTTTTDGTTTTTTTNKPTNTTTTKKTTITTTKVETKTEEKTEDDFYIASVSLKGIKENGEQIDIALSPTFNKDTYEYTCNITSDIQKIELEKDAGEYTNSVIVTGLEELKEGENIIQLQLSAEDHESKIYTIKVIKEKQEVIETVSTIEENEQKEEKTEKTETKMISMPLWVFIIMQIMIIIIEILIIYFLPWRNLFENRNKNIDID